jgi:D-inositol-3-phosphate glycosyltransferase
MNILVGASNYNQINNTMKIGFLCSSLAWGGLEINNLKLCQWLKERGYQPVLFCQHGSAIGMGAADSKVEQVEFSHRHKHTAIGSAYHLSKTLAENQINTVVIGHYHHFYISVWAKLFSTLPIKLIYWQQMQVVLNRKNFYHAFFYKALDAWITPLHYLKRQLLTNTVLPENKIAVIPLGVQIECFANNGRNRERSRKLLNLPENEFIIGTIGRIDKQKGQEYVIQAIRHLKDKGISLKAVFIGEETLGEKGYLNELHELTKSLGLENEIYFRGFMKDVALAFAALDMFVMSSLSEPIGMVTVEAMASGLAIVGTNTGGTPELLGNGEAGLLYTPSDSEQLASHLGNLYKHPEKRGLLGAKAKERAVNYSHITQCDLVGELLGRKLSRC